MSTIKLENLLGSENWREWFEELAPEEANKFLSLGEEAWKQLESIERTISCHGKSSTNLTMDSGKRCSPWDCRRTDTTAATKKQY